MLKQYTFFKSVAAGTDEVFEYTPEQGEEISVGVAWGEASISPDTLVDICWDEGGAESQIIYATHSSGRNDLVNFTATGNGTRKLKLRLTNLMQTAEVLGVGFRS